jgi:putative tryptophan/tyrosine transport system substrate-binding protein
VDRWPQPADRLSLGGRQRGLDTDVREGVGRPATRCDPRAHDSGDRRTPAGDADDPIVFLGVADPVGDSFVAGLARPGGNITGFINLEGAIAGKWLEALTEIAPGVKRAAIMFNPDTAPRGGSYFLPSFEAAARSLKVEPIAAPVRSDTEIETIITSLGREPRGGLVVMPDVFIFVHRAPIILLAARNNVPAVYFQSAFTKDGGLLSYGPDVVDMSRRSASYVDRILRGAKVADLPVLR